MFGDTPMAIPLSFENTKYPAIEDKMKTLIKNREEALAAHELARVRTINWRKSTFIPFKVEDWVWLDTRNLKTNHHIKIGPRREGPFKITKVIGPVTYQLNLPKSWRIHNVGVVHLGALLPDISRDFLAHDLTWPCIRRQFPSFVPINHSLVRHDDHSP